MAVREYNHRLRFGFGTEGSRDYYIYDELGAGPRVIFHSAAPIDGTWRAGDIVIDDSAGATRVGWKCTVGGTPGTWVEIGVGTAGSTIRLATIDLLNYGFGYVLPQDGSTNLTNMGMTLQTVSGTLSFPTPATTNANTVMKRFRWVTGAAAQSPSEARTGVGGVNPWLWRGNGAGLGGFFAAFLDVWFDVVNTDSRSLFVISPVMSLGAAGNWTTGSLNLIGFGFDDGDTNWQMVNNDGAGNIVKTDLGASFPKASGRYDLFVYCAANASSMQARMFRRDSAADTGILTASSDIPSTTTLLCPFVHVRNSPALGTATAMGWNSRGCLAVWNIGNGSPTYDIF